MESVLRAEALLAVEGFEAERRERAAQLREVLDGAGRPLSPNEVSAAQGLLDLGFPYAFELSPEELFALRESQRGSGLWISVLAAFAVPWVVTCGLLNALYAMEQLVRMGGGHCGMVSFAIGAGSAVIAVAAGYDAFRLAYRSIDHGQSAQRLMGWSLAAVALLAFDLCALAVIPTDWYCQHGWANAGWIVPFTLPLALLRLRRSWRG